MSTRKLFIFIFVVGILAKMLTVAPTDPDLWWHLKTGEYIVENGIPEKDPGFSYITAGKEWFIHEWLSEVVMWTAYDIGGMHAVMFLYAMILASIFFVLYIASPHKPYIAAFIVLFGVIASSTYLGPRPQMFNLLLGAVFVLLIEKVRTGAIERRWMWLLPLLTVVWANLHSGFLLGLVILGVYIAGGLVEQSVGYQEGQRSVQLRYFFLIGLATSLASLANPKTYQLWLYPFTVAGKNALTQTYITEWLSPNFHDPQQWGFGAYLLFGIVVASRSKKPVSPTELLFIVGTVAASLFQRRNIPIHVIVTIPIYCRHAVSAFNLETIANLKPQDTPRRLRIVNIILLAFVLSVAVLYFSRIGGRYERIIEGLYPVEATTFIKEQDLDQERIFNNFTWGGYLLWRGIPTFIDGRVDSLEDEKLDDYAEIQYGGENWQELLDKYDIEVILISDRSPLDELVKLTDRWEVIFHRKNVVIYKKSVIDQ